MNQQSEPLFGSLYGQVTYCRYSSEFNLDFGDLRLWVGHEQLRQVTRRVNGQVRALYAQPRPVDDQVDLCLSGYHGDALRLYPDELLDLQTLLNGTLVMVDLYQFLSDHQFRLENNPLH